MSGLLHPATGKYFGIEGQRCARLAGPSPDVRGQHPARKPDLIGQYVSWGKPFDTQAVANAWSYGALYYMAWEPFRG